MIVPNGSKRSRNDHAARCAPPAKLVLAILVLVTFALRLDAAAPPSFTRDVKPFLARYCLDCHNSSRLKGGLNLESYKDLVQGGKTGPVVVPANPDDSRLVLLVEGKEKPVMPPKPATARPKPAEVAVLRAWVTAGAKDDTSTVQTVLPEIKPRVPLAAPLTAVVYRPDGKLLAVGGYEEVILLDPAGGVIGKLPGQTARVTALAFSGDGQRLAVASGLPGKEGQIRLEAVPAAGAPARAAQPVIQAHQDVIYGLAFSPDGRQLASCGYDRLIKLWDTTTGHELRVLKDHSDSVYGLAYSPDGRLLASASADRAVKVWEVATGTRLYTLGDNIDWVYAVAWSPDGKHLAAAGVDRSIRVWEVDREGGKLVHSVFAHEASVTRLLYSPDARTLYSLSEDRTAKAWDAARMVERHVYARQPAIPQALALRPDGKQLALGRDDGVLLLLDEVTGQVQAQPLPEKPRPPQLAKLTPNSGTRGQTIRVRFEGKDLAGAREVTTTLPGATVRLVLGSNTGEHIEADILLPASARAGNYPLTVITTAGKAELLFTVDLYRQVAELEPNDSASTAQKLTLPVSVAGSLNQSGDVDFYRFEAKAGDQIGIQAVATAAGSKLEPVLQLMDVAGNGLVESNSGLLGYVCPSPGSYAVSIHDREYRGGNLAYRLHMGDIPVVTTVFPLGLQRGTEVEVHLEGVNLGMTRSVRVKAPADAVLGTRLPVPVTTSQGPPLGDPAVVVGEFPETSDGKAVVSAPTTANGRIAQPGAAETWRFHASKGTRLIVEINARRIGSPLDSFIEILDAHGGSVPRATLRAVAKTYTTFRDHDSTGPGIRLETWNELAMHDYLYVGSELVRIHELPKNPDDDCQFFSVNNQRVGYLDTTPTFHSLGTPMYKVAIHPPGTKFPPNGLPVVSLPYQNDDGGPSYGKDSRLFFDPPADGEYQVRVSDARGQGGSAYGYRLTVRPPKPGYSVRFSTPNPAVWKGGAIPVSATAERTDGFEGAIEIRLENLPPGFQAPATTIPAGENSTSFALFADPMATVPANAPPCKLVARAHIDGKEEVREVTGGVPKAVDPGDLVTTTEQTELVVRPGQQVKMTVKIDRRNGFNGRVPVEVRGLPPGVRVLDIGLNGILVTEKETTRSFVIYAEPWVEPTEHPIVVLAKREGKNTEHAARSVLLRVVK